MSRKSFTLLEILIAMVIIGILASVALPSYQSMVENANAKVCATNQEAIVTSLEIYAQEQDTMPGALSQIPESYLQRAYVKVLQKEGAWKIKLANLIISIDQRGFAHAKTITRFMELLGNQSRLLQCPNDSISFQEGVHYSYGINKDVWGISYQQYLNLSDKKALVRDNDSYEFNNGNDGRVFRHKIIRFFQTPRKYCLEVRKRVNVNKKHQVTRVFEEKDNSGTELEEDID